MQDNPLLKRFLESFQGDIRNNISTFCKTLWEKDYDVYIFMARKAACFFDCLRELGSANVRGLALSDRVLDMDLNFVKGKRVLLVDDCIFSGTTLHSAKRSVVNAGCKTFNTLSLAVNIDAIRHDILPNGPEWEDLRIIDPVFRISDSDCVRQCHDIVRAISILPRPYDVDFPHTKTIKIKDSTFDKIINAPGWRAFECGSDYQKKHGVRIFSIIPDKNTMNYFWESHSCTNSNFAKIRLYARKSQTSSSYSVRFVPIIMLPAIESAHVTESLLKVIDSESKLYNNGFISPRSRYRLLHFLAATSLLKYYEKRILQYLSAEILEVRRDLAEMSFSGAFWDFYLEARNNISNFKMPTCDTLTKDCQNIMVGTNHYNIENDLEFVSKVLEPFQTMYSDKELAAREYVKTHGLVYAEAHPQEHSKRLLEGVTPKSLSSMISCDTYDVDTIVSVLLDRIIDAGVAVPIIQESYNTCCRAFRHGEDALLGEAQERMILEAIKAYTYATNNHLVRGLELQKLIVLIVQIGIRRSFFDSIKLSTPPSKNQRIISNLGHLHGLVPMVRTIATPSGDMGAPYVEGNEKRPKWLVNEWAKRGYLARINQKGRVRYTVESVPKLSLGPTADAKARQIGRCLGTAVGLKALDPNHDLVMLSTCTEPDHMLRALSGEISIFTSRWPTLRRQLAELCRKQEFYQASNALRINNDVFTSINSGFMKYRWYCQNTSDKHNTPVETLVRNVSTILKNSKEDAMADEWIQLWPSAYPVRQGNGSYVWNYIDKCGRWLTSLNIALRLIDNWLKIKSFGYSTSNTQVTESSRDIQSWINKAGEIFSGQKKPGFIQECVDIEKNIDKQNETLAFKWSNLGGALANSFAQETARPLLDKVTAICNAYGEITGESVFPYALYFYCPDQERRLHELIEESVRRYSPDNYLYLPDNMNPYSIGRWILLSGGRNSAIASHVCSFVVESLIRNNYDFKAIVIGQLAKSDSITRFSGSTDLAENFFFDRILQLNKYFQIQRSSFRQLYFANETHDGINSEGVKFNETFDGNIEFTETSIDIGRIEEHEGDATSKKPFTIGVSSRITISESKSDEGNNMNIVLFTATNKEDDAIARYASDNNISHSPATFKEGTYRCLGKIGNATVYWVRSSMGSGGSGGSALTAFAAIQDIKPKYAISCGLCFGADQKNNKIGDIIVSTWVRCYEPGRQGTDRFIPRGDRSSASAILLQAARVWRMDRKDHTVVDGGFLSGEKLVDDPKFKEHILSIEPEALGGDMEGAGILDACNRRGVQWIVIKSICDWGEDKHGSDQPKSAANAVDFVISMISNIPLQG